MKNDDIDKYLSAQPRQSAARDRLESMDQRYLTEAEEQEYADLLGVVDTVYTSRFRHDRASKSGAGDQKDSMHNMPYDIIDLGVRTVGSDEAARETVVLAQPYRQTQGSYEGDRVDLVIYSLVFAMPHAGYTAETVGDHLHSRHNDMLDGVVLNYYPDQTPTAQSLQQLRDFARLCEDIALVAEAQSMPDDLSSLKLPDEQTDSNT